MQTPIELPHITLYFRAGGSDKVYQCAVEPAGERFVVNFAYGRRGAALSTGTKTSVPVNLADAGRIFDKLVKGKMAKGYTPGQDATPCRHAGKQPSGLLPQLLNSIGEEQVPGFSQDDNYCAQEKMDGHHKLIRKIDGRVEGINKKGFIVTLPETITSAVAEIGGDFILDGEQIGDVFHVFDCLAINGEDLRGKSYLLRMSALHQYDYELVNGGREFIKSVQCEFTTREKTELWERLRRENREGIVFKRLDAPYTPGKPNSGGPQLKFKFVATLSAVVAKTNRQRSVELQLLGQPGWVKCGNVTIPANHKIPSAGQVVEIRYLYAFPESGVLFQPVYLGLRDDVADNECLTSQLKFKPEDEP